MICSHIGRTGRHKRQADITLLFSVYYGLSKVTIDTIAHSKSCLEWDFSLCLPFLDLCQDNFRTKQWIVPFMFTFETSNYNVQLYFAYK